MGRHERRKLLDIRRAIDSADAPAKLAITTMARMLGPDRLEDLNTQVGRLHREADREYKSQPRNGRAIAFAKDMLRYAWYRIPHKQVLAHELTSYCFSDETTAQLEAAGLKTVEDFVSKKNEELKKLGLGDPAIQEVSGVLLNWGIRTADNPPQHPQYV